MLKVTVVYPEDIQGTEKTEMAMPVISKMHELSFEREELPSGDIYHFKGQMSEQTLVKTLQELTGYRYDDPEKLAAKLKDKTDGLIKISVEHIKSEAERIFDYLKERARDESNDCGLDIRVACSLVDSTMAEIADFSRNDGVFGLTVNGKMFCRDCSAGAIENTLAAISFGAKTVKEQEASRKERKSKEDEPVTYFRCNITEEERKALAEDLPIEGLEREPDRGTALFQYMDKGLDSVDIELNVNPDDSERGILDYYICVIYPDEGWGSLGYADDILGQRGRSNRSYIDISRDGWEKRLEKDMKRVLDEYLRYVEEHPNEDPRKCK